MTRTPSQIGRANRRNGRQTERAVRYYLRTWWPEIDYTHPGGPGRKHDDDRGDLGPLVDRDDDHWTVEVKGPRANPLPGDVDRWAAEAEAEANAAGMGGLWVLIVRRPGCADVARWHAWVPVWAISTGKRVGIPADDLACVTVRTWVALTAPAPF